MRPTLLCAGLITAFTLAGCGGGKGEQSATVAPERMRQAAEVQSSSTGALVIFNGLRANYSITAATGGYLVTDNTGSEPARTVAATARLRFSDQSLSFDIDGTPGQAYRLYRAAFARTPDLGGLGFWIGAIDNGASLGTVAQGFVDSGEFKNLYANATTNNAIVNRYYSNVLNRAGDPDGIAFWTQILDNKASTIAGVLTGFSESQENKDGTASAVQNGIAYLEYGVNYPGTAHTFLLRSAYHQRINTPGTDYLTISGDCSGFAAFSSVAPGSSTFEGSAALLAQSTVSLGLTTCSPSSLAWTTSDYFDSNDSLLGHTQSSADYDVSTGAQRSLPQVAKVGDSGVYATQLLYSDNSKQGNPGQRVLSYALTADGNSATTAILKLSVVQTDALGNTLLTRSTSYRIGTNGSLDQLGVDEVYSNSIHLVYTETPASAQPAKLTVTDTLVGGGAAATAGQTLTVNYTGWLYNPSAPNFKGQQFDTSVGRGAFSFTLGAGQVIGGWDQGMAGMKVGGKRTLLIPSNLGYGTSGAGASIPGNAALVFDVELISVK